jgi:hypothetical protein
MLLARAVYLSNLFECSVFVVFITSIRLSGNGNGFWSVWTRYIIHLQPMQVYRLLSLSLSLCVSVRCLDEMLWRRDIRSVARYGVSQSRRPGRVAACVCNHCNCPWLTHHSARLLYLDGIDFARLPVGSSLSHQSRARTHASTTESNVPQCCTCP